MTLKLTQTRLAVAEYDEKLPGLEAKIDRSSTNEQCLAAVAEIERLGERVGIAFWEDTKDRNSLDTCRECVRPGFAEPAPGQELSFVRKLLAKEGNDNGKN